MRILLIEDDPQIGDGLNRGLQKMNMAVDWFRDGLQGVESHLGVAGEPDELRTGGAHEHFVATHHGEAELGRPRRAR